MGLAAVEYALWDLQTDKATLLARDRNPAGNWVVFSTSGKQLAYPAGEKTITLWDLAKGARDRDIELPFPGAGELAFSCDDRLLALPCRRREDSKTTLLIWDLARGAERARFLARGAGLEGVGVTGLAFRPAGSQLAVGDGSRIALVDAAEGKEIVRFDAGQQLGLGLLAWQADGRHLVSAGLDGALKVWELSGETLLASLQPEVEKTAAFAFSPDGKWLAVASATAPKAWLIRRQTGKVGHELTLATREPRPGPFARLIFRPDGKQVAALAGFGKAVVWDTETGTEVARLETPDTFSFSAAFGAQGHLLVVRNPEGKLLVWDVNESRSIWETPADPGLVGYLSSGGCFLVGFGARFGTPGAWPLTVWELPTGRKSGAFSLEGSLLQPAFSPDGGLLAASYVTLNQAGGRAGEGGLRVWALPSGKQVMDVRGLATTIAFSPDGRLLAVGTSPGSLTLWNVARGEEILTWAFPARELAFTPDGSHLATRGWSAGSREDHTPIRLLDLAGLRRRLTGLGLDW
jgi:WD40 repeat protein